MMLGKYSEALHDAREATRLDHTFVKGYIRVAKCNTALGDATAALSVLREAGEVGGGSQGGVREETARAMSLIKCQEEIEKAYGKEDYRTAIFHLDRALDLAVGCRAMKIRKAEYLVMLQRYAEAQEMVNEILQFDNSNVDAIYVRGLCLYYQDNPEAAFNHFTHVLRLAPDHTKAKDSYKKAKALKQKKEEGNEAFRRGRHAEALALYSEALSIDPRNTNTNAKLYFNRATVNSKLSRLESATEDCTAAINLDDGYLKAYLRRAKCYQQLERHEDAVRDYEKVLRLDKNQEHKRLLQEAKVQLKRSKRKDYYKILGVTKTASDDEIKKSYKKMALIHHPDRHSSASEKDKNDHEVKFKEIGEAYAVLTDTKKRAMYDRGHDFNDPDGGFGHEGHTNLTPISCHAPLHTLSRSSPTLCTPCHAPPQPSAHPVTLLPNPLHTLSRSSPTLCTPCHAPQPLHTLSTLLPNPLHTLSRSSPTLCTPCHAPPQPSAHPVTLHSNPLHTLSRSSPTLCTPCHAPPQPSAHPVTLHSNPLHTLSRSSPTLCTPCHAPPQPSAHPVTLLPNPLHTLSVALWCSRGRAVASGRSSSTPDPEALTTVINSGK
ncbi:DnaJ subfamily C member 7 [Chionoecetes opilio]|uniref:DnaJ subfamily C member 7 n=1 Tax=Chionoecetes opilio TaxID=41210 RepID=A0A8J5D2N6_CHIOP|nr:DnaJ subfamily C member 7 [Chionoecetes opilio]